MKTFLSPLTPEQEMECLKKMKDGDLEAKKELTLRNMRLVAHVAKKYQNSDEDMEDLISIGTIGLIKAISTYKEDYGSRLATYAARCIDNELLMHFRSKKKTAREVSLYEPIGTDKEGNQIHLLDIVESDEPDVVETIETDRRTREVLTETVAMQGANSAGEYAAQVDIADVVRQIVTVLEKPDARCKFSPAPRTAALHASPIRA